MSLDIAALALQFSYDDDIGKLKLGNASKFLHISCIGATIKVALHIALKSKNNAKYIHIFSNETSPKKSVEAF